MTLLKRYGISEVVSTLHYLSDEIQSYFGDGSDFGVTMHYSVEDTPLGTAGSVKKAEELLRDNRFLIISGDAMTDCNLQRAIEFHESRGAIATLILYRVENPLDFGVVITDDDGKVVRFLEKPSWSEVFSDTVNTGMYILEPEVFDLMEQGKQYDWSQDIFPKLLRDGKPIFGYVMDEYWCDVGSLNQYREAQEHLLSGRARLPIQGEQIRPGVWAQANCQIDDEAILVPPIALGRNCKIKRGARVGPHTVIGDNALIEEDSTIDRSVLWDSAYVGPNVQFHSAIAGSRVTIKRDSRINEDAVIGDRCLVDVGCHIRPRVKLWPDKIIERGSTVTMSLVWGNKWRGSLFRDLGVAGLSNIEITPEFATRLGSAFGSVLPAKSRVVTSRDSTRSSRMIKRAVIASLLSVGCDVLDLRSVAVPIARHFIKVNGVDGAINVRKLPGNARVTLLEMFDAHGAYLPRAMERKVETAFFREDFKRTDPDDLGMIESASLAIEGYEADFFKKLNMVTTSRRMRIVVDYGNSALSNIYPAMLAKMDIESISLNSHNDAKLAPRNPSDVQRHVDNLKQIVHSLETDLGVLFTDDGERLIIVDDKGQVLSGNSLFAAICMLTAQTDPSASIAMSVTAPSRLEEALKKLNTTVIRTKADTRSLMSTALDSGVSLAGDDSGGFIFPDFHPGYDAAFTFAKLIAMLRKSGLNLSEVSAAVPPFQLAYESVRCPWESKGVVMRIISEEQPDDARVELVDGIKIFDRDNWVLVLPDALEPIFHVYAESAKEADSKALVQSYVEKIEQFQSRE